jgi:uncharacterized membrane protein
MISPFLLYPLELTELLLVFIGVIIITYSALNSFAQLIHAIIAHKLTIAKTNTIRGTLGYGIILGLEFLVAADIVTSVIKPDYYNLGILAILVIIRTLLSFFLNKELEAATKHNSHGA